MDGTASWVTTSATRKVNMKAQMDVCMMVKELVERERRGSAVAEGAVLCLLCLCCTLFPVTTSICGLPGNNNVALNHARSTKW